MNKILLSFLVLMLISVTLEASTNKDFGEFYKSELKPEKHLSPFQKSLIEIGSIYALRTAVYSKSGALQDNDFRTWSLGVSERFKSKKPYRFDDNSLAINHIGHALLPAYETTLFRSNGMGFYTSLYLQFTASTIWEFIVEAKETVSLNDVLVTPVAGASISEVMFQFSQFYRHSANTKHNRILGALFSGPMAFNYWINGDKRKPSENLDKHGFDANVFHSFKNYTGLAVSGSNAMVQVGAEMELINIKDYAGPGNERRYYKDPVGAEFTWSLAANAKSVNEVRLLMQTMFAAYHLKNIGVDSSRKVHGNTFLIGLTSGYEVNYAQFSDVKDNFITLHVLGVGAEWLGVNGKTLLRVKIKAYSDFASISSLVVDDYVASHGGLNNVKSTVRQQDYYHAVGGALLSEVTLKYGKFSLGGKQFFGKYSSVDGYDRHQELVTNDFHLDDFRSQGKVWISFLPIPSVELQAGYEERKWESRIGNLNRNPQVDWLFGRVVLLY